jgi:hypothetical protein
MKGLARQQQNTNGLGLMNDAKYDRNQTNDLH